MSIASTLEAVHYQLVTDSDPAEEKYRRLAEYVKGALEEVRTMNRLLNDMLGENEE